MGQACIGFEMEDPIEARKHMQLKLLIDYGDHACGHSLQPWDEGGRRLCRCKACGGYVFIQDSEFHAFDRNDSYYMDYYPVSGPEEADALNREFDGWQLEARFPRRFLSCTNGIWGWRKGIEQHD